MKSGYPPSTPGTRVIFTDLESSAEGVPDPIAHLRSIAGRNRAREEHDARPIEFFALLRCKHGWLFPSSQMNERPEKGRPSKTTFATRADYLPRILVRRIFRRRDFA